MKDKIIFDFTCFKCKKRVVIKANAKDGTGFWQYSDSRQCCEKCHKKLSPEDK